MSEKDLIPLRDLKRNNRTPQSINGTTNDGDKIIEEEPLSQLGGPLYSYRDQGAGGEVLNEFEDKSCYTAGDQEVGAEGNQELSSTQTDSRATNSEIYGSDYKNELLKSNIQVPNRDFQITEANEMLSNNENTSSDSNLYNENQSKVSMENQSKVSMESGLNPRESIGDSSSNASSISQFDSDTPGDPARNNNSGNLDDDINIEKKPKRKKKKMKFRLSPPNLFSDFFMIWILNLIQLSWKVSDIRNIFFILNPSETAKISGNRLNDCWIEQLRKIKGYSDALDNLNESIPNGRFPSLTPFLNNIDPDKSYLLNALWDAFGRSYAPLGLWKLFWVGFTWIGNYYSFSFLLAYKQAQQDNNNPEPVWHGHIYALGIFVCSFLGSLSFHHLTIKATKIGIQCRAALMVMIYRKSLKLSYVKGGVGDIVNLISVECNRVAEACVFLHYLWSAAFECIVLLIWSMLDIGIAALAPFALVFFVLFPLQYYLAINASSSACKLTSLITKRVHLMSEVLTAIKLIKFYTWEQYFRKKISDMRSEEMLEMKKEIQFKIASFAIVFATPAFVTCFAIALYRAIGFTLFAQNVFTLLFLLNTLRYPLMFLPNAERNINGAQTSIRKLQDFFLLPEIDSPAKSSTTLAENVCMEIKDADFIWDGDLDHPHIYNLSLTLYRNQVVAIVGDIGSGKSLLAAIMGQIKRKKGTVVTDGAVCGFVSQEPWFINATLRENIIFGVEEDEKKYNDAIRISGLTRDFLMLSLGDESFIYDLNLTPAQKQRLSLARCIYHCPDIILMEDILSDFDQSQARQLFKECIKNQLAKRNACIVMLTQQKQFLPECDSIVVMKGGRVVETGTYEELKKRHVNFSAWVTDVVHIDDDPNGLIDNLTEIKLEPSSTTLLPQASSSAASISPLRTSESGKIVAGGSIANRVPVGSFSHLQQIRRKAKPRSSPLASAKPINADLISQQNTIRQIKELNSTSVQTNQLNEQTISKMIERSQNSVLTGTSTRPPANFANQDLVSRTIEANSLTIHSLQGFDVSLLHKDIPTLRQETVEEQREAVESIENVNPYIHFFDEKGGAVFGYIFLVAFISSHAIRFISDVWIMYLIDDPDNYYKNIIILGSLSLAIVLSIFIRGFGFLSIIVNKGASWHAKILDSILSAPMSFYDVTPLGHILSFFAKHLFSVDEILPDTALQVLTFLPLVLGTMTIACIYVPWLWATLPLYFILWWLIVRGCNSVQNVFKQLESSNKSPMFAHLSTTLEGLFLIRLYHTEERFDYFNSTLIDADDKALYSLLLVKGFMSAALDLVSSLFIYMTALFVVLFSVTASETGLAVSNSLQLLLFVPLLVKMFFELDGSMISVSSLIYFGKNSPKEATSKGSIEPDASWPSRGEIEFREVTSKYQRYGVSVLKNVSFHIASKEKIAIVGRSGSGKTSILMTLLRIMEPSEGKIYIDELDISKISLTNLRSRIAIIPQEPVMLTGTIRSNLDPFGNSADDAIWNALHAVHLGEKISEMPDKLETSIIENGRMFNVSERQLFCIARAILIQSPIVVYDEPAVTVDRDTERLIQQVMNENFSQCTVIFLATRFRVIVQMDRVMVMKHGEIVEFDTPLALLDNPKSKFSLMLSQTGDVDPVSLRQLAQKKATAKENGGAPAMFRTGSKSSGSSAIPNTLNHLFPGATSNSFKSYSSQEDSDGRRLSNEQRVLTVPSSDLRNIIVIPAENESQREKQ